MTGGRFLNAELEEPIVFSAFEDISYPFNTILMACFSPYVDVSKTKILT